MRGRVETEFGIRITCYDTMINYHLSQKVKLLEKCEFNHNFNRHNIWFLVAGVRFFFFGGDGGSAFIHMLPFASHSYN